MKNLAHMRDSGCLSCFFSIILRGKIGARPANIDHLAHVWRLAAVLG